MRAIFGLVSLLVVVAIIAYLFSIYDIPVAKQGKVAQQQARQLSGHGEDGTPADRTITLDADYRNNKLDDLVVTSVVPGGAMDRFYGFQAGDKIVLIGDYDIHTNDDFETAEAMLVQEGFEKGKPVTVIRKGQKIQLPLPGQAAAAAAAPSSPSSGSTTSTPASPSGAESSEKSMIRQLQGISDQK